MRNIKSTETFSESGQRQFKLMEKMDYVRVAGTEGEVKGANALLDELTSFGVSGHLEEFDFCGYTMTEARFEVLEPYQKEYTITGYGLSGSCNIEAPFYYAENGEEVNLADVKGKIVMLNGAMSVTNYKNILKAGVVGFVTISGTPFDTLEDTDLETRSLRTSRHLSGGAVKIPGATIRYNDAVELIEQEAASVRLTVNQEEKTTKCNNVIADIKGSSNSDEMIVFMAHYDSVPFSPGAYDNSAGAAIIMEMCRYFKVNPPLRNVRFTWFSGEEIGLLGSAAYVKQHMDEVPNMVLGINVDLAGHAIGNHSISVTGDMSMLNALDYMTKEGGIPMFYAQEVCSSDSTSFSDAGIPTLSLRRNGYGGHNRKDMLSLISAKSLQKTAEILCYMGEKIVNSVFYPFNRELPQNMKDGLNRYFGRE